MGKAARSRYENLADTPTGSALRQQQSSTDFTRIWDQQQASVYATVEALGHDKAKARIVAASGEDTVRISVFDSVRGYSWPGGITGRALRNNFTECWHSRERELTATLDGEKERYWAATERGDPDTAVVFAGEGVDQIDDLPHAGAEMVTRLVVEAERALAGAARLVI